MTPVELFGVFVRAVGFVLVVYGTITDLWATAFLFATPPTTSTQTADHTQKQPPYGYLFLATIILPLGVFIIAQADAIARMAYRSTEKPLPTKSSRI